MCDVLLPPGVNPTAVKYIYNIISYINISSRPCSVLWNNDTGATQTEVQHALVNTKQKQQHNQKHNKKTQTLQAVPLFPKPTKCNVLPSAVNP
jgi:hypothetical protein